MAECIEREAAITKIRAEGTLSIGYHSDKEVEDDIVDMLERLPAADVAPVVYGRWVHDPASSYRVNIWFCSACNGEATRKYNYCPSCGAKMEAW